MTEKNNIQLKYENTSFESEQFPIQILANHIELAGNIGSLFRIADSFGVERLYLSGQSEADTSLKIRKTARSTHKKVGYRYIK